VSEDPREAGTRLDAPSEVEGAAGQRPTDRRDRVPSKLSIDPATCTGCGCCVLSCPVDAVVNPPSFVARIDETVCTQCLECIDCCPTRAIRES
jgi:ferredoxin